MFTAHLTDHTLSRQYDGYFCPQALLCYVLLSCIKKLEWLYPQKLRDIRV